MKKRYLNRNIAEKCLQEVKCKGIALDFLGGVAETAKQDKTKFFRTKRRPFKELWTYEKECLIEDE